MSKTTKLPILFLTVVFCLGLGFSAIAQEPTVNNEPALISAEEEGTAQEAVEQDEAVSAEDLGLKEPGLLPDSPFYFLKNWSRGLNSFFTFNKVKKAELKLKHASEKLLEARALALKNKKAEIQEKAVEKFQSTIDSIKDLVDKFKENGSTSPAISKFTDKYIKQEALHLKILEKLQNQAPTSTAEKIETARQRHLTNFGLVMAKLETKTEQLAERLEKNLEELKGSTFKQFKNLDILKQIEEKAPEQAKEAIQKARENTLFRLKEKVETMPEEAQEKLQEYVEQLKVLEERKMELLEDLKSTTQVKAVQRVLNKANIQVMEKARERVEKETGGQCPLNMINPEACRGRMIIEQDADGCPVPKCIELAPGAKPAPVPSIDSGQAPPTSTEPRRACIALWDPVCGVDNNTYTNKCWANLKGVRVAYQGRCREPQVIEAPLNINIEVEAEPARPQSATPLPIEEVPFN